MSEDVLFEPLSIKGVTLANRFVVPAMQRACGQWRANRRHRGNYRRCAKGGISLVIGESTAPAHPSAEWQPIYVGWIDKPQAAGGAWPMR